MERVAIVGNGGGGKSTLAARLAKAHGLAHVSVDQIQWRPGWTAAPGSKVAQTLDALADGDRWIIDGWGPWSSIEHRLKRADTIVFVDFPLWMHFWLAAERQIAIARGTPRADPVEGCDDLAVTKLLFQTLWHVDQEMKPRLAELVEANRGGKRFVHATSIEQLDAISG